MHSMGVNYQLIREFVSLYTDVGQAALPAISGFYSLYKQDYAGTGYLCLAVAVNQAATEVLKRLFNTTRPNGRKRSFPSGNTSAAFLGPSFLVVRHKLLLTNPLVASSCFLAGLVAEGRVYINVHWQKDVVGGAILGCVVTKLVVPPL